MFDMSIIYRSLEQGNIRIQVGVCLAMWCNMMTTGGLHDC